MVLAGALLLTVLLAASMMQGSTSVTPQASPGSPTTASHGATTPSSGVSLPPANYQPVIIPAGNTTYWNRTAQGEPRLQQGSVTVDAGGTLVIQNVTVSIVQPVSASGTLAERLANISTFLDEGVVILRNATLTTDASIADAYLKLNLTVTGTLSLWESALGFPGWVNIEDSATVTLNQSIVRANPDAGETALGATIVGDTSYAPTISVTSGGHLTLLNSTVADTYADNTTANGSPGPLALTDNETVTVSPTTNQVLTGFETPTQSPALIQDWLYPTTYPEVELVIEYSMTTGTVSSVVNVTFNRTTVAVASVTFQPGVDENTTLILPPALLSAINQAGPAGFLRSTGSFDHNAPYLSVGFGATLIGNSSATVHQTRLLALPELSYNITLAGATSVLTAADSSLELTWEPLASSPHSTAYPYPWH